MVLVSAQPYDYELPTDSGLALLIIDMQRDFLEPGGFGDVLGNDVSRLQVIVPTVKQLLEAFRARQLPIFHTIEGHLPDLSNCPMSKQKRGQGKLRIGDVGPMGRILVLGEPGNAIIAELEPRPCETVIAKPGKLISCTWKYECQNRNYVQESSNVQYQVKEETQRFEEILILGQLVQPHPSQVDWMTGLANKSNEQ